MKRIALVLVLLVLSPMLFAAEDVSGTWAGTFIVTNDQNPPRNSTAHLVLKQTGATVTGTAGPNEGDQEAIAHGKVATVKKDGKDVTSVTFDMQDTGGPLVHFVLSLVAGHLKGTADAAQDGHKMSAAIDVTRLKK